MKEITVEIWTDLVCPWCYIGKRQFELALTEFEHRDAVNVVHRSFELEPDAPLDNPLTIPQRMQKDLGMSADWAAMGVARLANIATELGLDYRLELARPVNSFNAHRLLHYAVDQGVGEEVRDRVMRAYTGEGAHLGDTETLVGLGAEAGLDPEGARKTLDGIAYADAVRSDECRGRNFGVSGVPSFLFDERRLLPGFPGRQYIVDQLERTWRD